ncbi:MAG: hypothetical protein PHU34_06670 [Candidatus Methanoperedens sp.]|nr:hypothetical protein [Candidatus Methanoperedens sp.]
MNWIDRLFGKKESSPRIKFEELPLWLEAKSKKISEGIGRQASSIYSDIDGALSKIKESTTLLEEAEPEGRFHLKMVKVATTNRDNMARQVRMLLENITIPQAADVKSVAGFHENAIQTLTVCLENMMKSYQYTKLVFIEESKQVIADVNALGRLLNELIEPVNTQKNVLDAIENARSIIKNIKNISSDIEIGEKAITEYGERIALLNKELEGKQTALTRLRDSESWKQYNNYKDELVLLEINAGKKEAEIKGLISPLNKALGRLKQLSDSGRYTLKPEIKEGLNLCLLSPLNVASGFFIEFQNIAASGVLNMNTERTNKLMEQIQNVVSSLNSSKEEYLALVKDIERKKDEISGMNIAFEETDMTKGISAMQEKLAGLEIELEISKNHVSALKNNLELKMQDLQRNIFIIDDKIKIS